MRLEWSLKNDTYFHEILYSFVSRHLKKLKKNWEIQIRTYVIKWDKWYKILTVINKKLLIGKVRVETSCLLPGHLPLLFPPSPLPPPPTTTTKDMGEKWWSEPSPLRLWIGEGECLASQIRIWNSFSIEMVLCSGLDSIAPSNGSSLKWYSLMVF